MDDFFLLNLSKFQSQKKKFSHSNFPQKKYKKIFYSNFAEKKIFSSSDILCFAMKKIRDVPLVYLIAGEPSGDFLGEFWIDICHPFV
jgi:hypothetical protein